MPTLDVSVVSEKLSGQIIYMHSPEVLSSTAVKISWEVRRNRHFVEGFRIKYRIAAGSLFAGRACVEMNCLYFREVVCEEFGFPNVHKTIQEVTFRLERTTSFIRRCPWFGCTGWVESLLISLLDGLIGLGQRQWTQGHLWFLFSSQLFFTFIL